MKWFNLCQSKTCGGIGLKNLKTMNDALLMKISRGILSDPSSYLVQVVYQV